MLFKESDIENLVVCDELALTLNLFYDSYFNGNIKNSTGGDENKEAKIIFFKLYELILKIDLFFYSNKYYSVDGVEKLNTDIQLLMDNASQGNYKIDLSFFFQKIVDFFKSLNDLVDYNDDFKEEINIITSSIEVFNNVYVDLGKDLSKGSDKFYKIFNSYMYNKDEFLSKSQQKLILDFIEKKFEDLSEKNNEILNSYFKIWSEEFVLNNSSVLRGDVEKKIQEYDNTFIEVKKNFENKSELILEKLNDEINLSKISFKKDVQDEVLKFQKNLKDVDADFKSSVKDFEVLKKFINAKGEKEVTDHYRNKAKWERITYWLMTIITFGIIVLSVCMAIKGLDEYKEKANISVETLLEKYKDQPVEKIEKIYGAVQSSALTYLVLRLIFSVLLFSSIIYTSRVAYRAYVHMRHSENMMLKLATLRPFINQLDESERNQIHKDLVPDYFGKDAGLVDGASEKFKDLPANVSAVAMKAIEQIGGSTGTSNSKSPDPKDAKTAGE